MSYPACQEQAAARSETRLAARPDRHLGRRPHLGIIRPDRQKAHAVAPALRDALRPVLELGPSPLEAVIAVAKALGWQLLLAHIVLSVRRGQHDHGRARELKEHTLEARQAMRIKVLDHLDHSGGIVACQPSVAVG